MSRGNLTQIILVTSEYLLYVKFFGVGGPTEPPSLNDSGVYRYPLFPPMDMDRTMGVSVTPVRVELPSE